MNVLLLTPDAVGGTLLQRLITIYMQFHEFDRPVINLHELTNGLLRYYSPEFNRELLGKPPEWTYFQSLGEITDLLKTTDHYKTTRLGMYHIRNRKDTMADQMPFYRYLDDNFFVISCRRKNLFEHALSHGINGLTKRINVYDPLEKIDSFVDLYRDPVDIDVELFVNMLDDYRDYLQWANDNFNIGSIYYYERDLPNIEKYILNLPIFSGQPRRVGWKDTYGMTFDEWNQYHYLSSDIGQLAIENPERYALMHDNLRDQKYHGTKIDSRVMAGYMQQRLLKDYSVVRDSSWPEVSEIGDVYQLPEHIKQEMIAQHGITHLSDYFRVMEVVRNLPEQNLQFLRNHAESFLHCKESLDLMQRLGILVMGVPIKKQTLAEKLHIVKNYRACLDAYNEWVIRNPGLAEPLSEDSLHEQAHQDQRRWHDIARLTTDSAPPVQSIAKS